jgi:hypothetical protein
MRKALHEARGRLQDEELNCSFNRRVSCSIHLTTMPCRLIFRPHHFLGPT